MLYYLDTGKEKKLVWAVSITSAKKQAKEEALEGYSVVARLASEADFEYIKMIEGSIPERVARVIKHNPTMSLNAILERVAKAS